MTQSQMIVAIFLAAVFPTVTALVGIVMNRNESTSVRSEISSVRSEIANVRERLARVEEKLSIAG